MTIGERLTEERRRQGKTIRDVEKHLRIKSKYIEAIENDQFDLIPASAYTKAFIKSYAQFLGIDSKPLIEEYKRLYEHPVTYEFPKEKKGISFSVNLKMILALALTLIIFMLGYFFSGEKQPITSKKYEKVKGEKRAQKPEIKEVFKEASSTTTPSERRKTFTLKVKSIDEKGCWLRVTIDGEKKYEGILQPDETKSWEAFEKITLKMGNPAGIQITKNGVTVPLKEYYRKTEKTFSWE